MPLRPQDVCARLNGMQVDGAGTWSARLDIAAEKSCWLIRCSGQRLTTEIFAADPNEWDSRPEAEMCVWYKSAKLFMKDAKGLLNEHAFAAEYVKGSIRMTGDREKAQAHYCHPGCRPAFTLGSVHTTCTLNTLHVYCRSSPRCFRRSRRACARWCVTRPAPPTRRITTRRGGERPLNATTRSLYLGTLRTGPGALRAQPVGREPMGAPPLPQLVARRTAVRRAAQWRAARVRLGLGRACSDGAAA